MTNLRKQKKSGKIQKEPRRRSSAVGKIFLIGGVVLAIVLVYASLRGSEDAQVESRYEQSLRLYSVSTSEDRYTAEELSRLRRASRQTLERIRNAPSPLEETVTQPLPVELAAQLQEALLEVANTASYTGAWNWLAVRSMVLRFGTDIPVFFIADHETEVRAAWDNHGQRLLIFPSLIGTQHHNFVATIIHEATHAVVTEQLASVAGLTVGEIVQLRESCEEFSRELVATTEVLAYLNGGMWKRLHEIPVYPLELWVTETFHELPPEDWNDVVQATSALMEYVYDVRAGALGIARLPNCGLIFAERGPRRGEIIRPSMIAPEYMAPILLQVVQRQ